MIQEKKCNICKIIQPPSEFYIDKASPDGFQGRCKSCSKNVSASYYKNFSKDMNAKRRVRHLKNTFGITPCDYQKIFNDQNGKCAICGTFQEDLERRLAIDHDHNSGKIRGLLCNSCNNGLGRFKDSVENLKRATAYLERHK